MALLKVPRRGDSHLKMTEVFIPFRDHYKCSFVPLRVFGLKRSTAGAFDSS